MHCLFFIDFISTFVLLWHSSTCQGQIHSTIVVTKATNCQMSGLKWLLRNVTTKYQYPKTYINVSYQVTDDINKLFGMYFHIERCNDKGYYCEDFQNWKIDDFCKMITWKKQIWSEFVEAIQPPFRCPIKKAFYEARNASVDVDPFVKWYPGLEKYHWKTQLKILNEYNNIVYCGVVEADFHQFRIQDSKKPSRKSTLE